MNGLIRTLVLVLGGAIGVAQAHAQPCATCPPTTGHNNTELFDRCRLERYSNLAQRGVNRAFAPQVLNGHVLDQTVWNHHFELGTDRLTRGGLAHLQYISRRRPEPDRTVYLATSNDITYDAACPERYCGAKQELDALRAAAIQKFMAGNNCGRCADFQILVHDPADVTLHTEGVGRSVRLMYVAFRGSLGAGSSSSSSTTTTSSSSSTPGAPPGGPGGGAGSGAGSAPPAGSGAGAGGNP